METFRPIDLQHERDFGRKINATFEFIKQNFKTLAKSILLIAGPSALIGSVFMGSFFSNYFSHIGQVMNRDPDAVKYFSSASYLTQALAMYVFLMLSFVIAIAVINAHIEIYHEKKTNQIEVGEVWERARGLILKYMGSLFLMMVCMIVIVFVIVAAAIVFQKVSTLLMVLTIIAAFIGFFYLMVGMSLVFFIQAHEGTGFFEAANRSLYLIRGKWWSTFGLWFVLSMIAGIISYIFLIPYYVVMFTSAMHKTPGATVPTMSESMSTATYIFFTLYFMAQMLLQCLPQIGLAFQYFNLVERKEAKGLMSDIENFGNPAEEQRNESF